MRLITHDNVAAILEDHLELCAKGFCAVGHFHKIRWAASLNDTTLGWKRDREDAQRSLEHYRRELLRATDECERAAQWLRAAKRKKRINPHASSYTLKHLAERAYPGVGPFYISNGAFIVAAIHMGFKFHRRGSDAFINISQKFVLNERARLERIATPYG